MVIEFPGIARIVEMKPDVFQAQILLDGSMKPIDFMCRDFHSTVAIKLKELYPNVEVVRNQVFLCELDHINLFDCRSDEQDWTPAMSDEDVEHLTAALERQNRQLEEELETREQNIVLLRQLGDNIETLSN